MLSVSSSCIFRGLASARKSAARTSLTKRGWRSCRALMLTATESLDVSSFFDQAAICAHAVSSTALTNSATNPFIGRPYNHRRTALQCRLRIGYDRDAHLIDLMEHGGLAGPADGSRPRELL